MSEPFNYLNEFDNLADAICVEVSELPDRRSPDDEHDMMLVTAEELAGIVHRRLRENPPFQARVADWMLQCFTPAVTADKVERNDRFIEEALELVQSLGYGRDRAHALVDYVFDRPVGEPPQEVGGVMVTLAALCGPNGLDLQMSAEMELRRILAPEVIAKIRAKQAAKPTGSALPIGVDVRMTPDVAGRLREIHQLAANGVDAYEDRLDDAPQRMVSALRRLIAYASTPALGSPIDAPDPETLCVHADTMANIIQYWLDWQLRMDGPDISDDTNFYTVPQWPSRRMWKEWVKSLKHLRDLAAAKAMEPAHV